MARKSVREMNYFERLHYSLSAKMWHAIIRFSIILALTAFVFGLLFYSHQLREQYSNKASVLAGSIELVVDPDIMDRIAKSAAEVYNGLPENVRNDPSSQAYQDAFASLMDIRYRKIEEILDEFRQQDNARYIIIGTMVDQDRFMYLFESNETEKHPLGHIEIVDQKTISAFEKISSLMPVIFNRDDSGYSCTGAGTIVKNGRDIASIVTAYSLNDVAYKVRAYLLQFFIIMTVLTILSDIYFVRKMKRTVVAPIIELNEAARLHMQEKSEEFRTLHFSNLNIRTGDEIESLALIMADMEKEIQEYVKDLTRITAERERISTELNVASKIQEGMLPQVFPPFPDRPEFDVYASMYTAKEVGGDFYDFFLIDDDHLALVIADVSGKGIPAALFMMASKIIISNLSTVGITDPAKILEEVNRRIVRNNPAEMFVTVWLGILEISSGILRASNGGHEYPCVLMTSDRYGVFKDRHGFVLGGIDNSTYQTYELKLEKGNRIFVYTDGVTEAMNKNHELFGEKRLLKALNDKPDASVRELLEHMKESIDAFVEDAPQFDDITMLALQYNGGSNMEELTIEATIDNIPAVTEFVDRKLEELDCPMKIQAQIDVAIDELFSNIAKYAYNPDTGPATVRVEVENDPMAVIITFIDHGMPYDPLSNKDPDVNIGLEDRMIGGLGIFLVKKTMDDISYEYKDGQNILKIRKNI
jgi:sigma-B regulation protein RsbU (phosphoserine phosphatase)